MHKIIALPVVTYDAIRAVLDWMHDAPVELSEGTYDAANEYMHDQLAGTEWEGQLMNFEIGTNDAMGAQRDDGEDVLVTRKA